MRPRRLFLLSLNAGDIFKRAWWKSTAPRGVSGIRFHRRKETARVFTLYHSRCKQTTTRNAEESGMAVLTGGEAIVQALLAHGVDTVFGLPGAQIYGLFDAFQRAQPQLKVIGARHEQACS